MSKKHKIRAELQKIFGRDWEKHLPIKRSEHIEPDSCKGQREKVFAQVRECGGFYDRGE